MPWRGASVVVRKTCFLRNHELNQWQILWKGSYPPYLQTLFSFYSKFWVFEFNYFFFVFVNMEPRGSWKFQNHTPPHSYSSFSTKLFLKIPRDSPHKGYLDEC